MACERISTFFLLSVTFRQTDGKLITVPSDTVSMVNQPAYFNCSTTLESEEMFWLHEGNYVYAANKIYKPYDVRFKTEHNKGSCNLLIQSVEPGDAGEYTCSEEDFEEKPSAQLIVIDSDPVCQSNIKPVCFVGQNTCHRGPDEVELSCSVTFYGSRSPAMEWRKIGDDKAITEGLFLASSGNVYNMTVKLKGEAGLCLNDSSYVCQTTEAKPSPYKCNLTIKCAEHCDGMGTDQEFTRDGQNIVSESSRPCFVIAVSVLLFFTISSTLIAQVVTVLHARQVKKRMGDFIATEVRNDLRAFNISEKHLDNMIEKWNNDLGNFLRKGNSSNATELRSGLLRNSSDAQKSMSCESQSRNEIVRTEIA